MPAISATLCLSEGIGDKLHNMICSFTRSSSDPTVLIAKVHKWPKKEPWGKLLQANPNLPPILRRHQEQFEDSIISRGQRGGDKLVQPRSFQLSCPSCGRIKECSNIRLFTTRVRTIACTSCNRSIVSSKWSCTCHVPWLQCESHRRAGFACGLAKTSSHKFAARSRGPEPTHPVS